MPRRYGLHLCYGSCCTRVQVFVGILCCQGRWQSLSLCRHLDHYCRGIFLWDCWSGFRRLVLLWVRRQVHRRPTQVQVRTKSTFLSKFGRGKICRLFLLPTCWLKITTVTENNIEIHQVCEGSDEHCWSSWDPPVLHVARATTCHQRERLSGELSVFVVVIDHSRTFLLFIYFLFLVVFVSVSFKQ